MTKEKQENKEGDSKPFYDKILKSNAFVKLLSGKINHRVATAMIYERIGDSEYFLGGYPLLKGSYHQIGEYYVLEIGSRKYFMDCLGSEVFTPCKDKKLGKIVEIVKYSDDDYRVRTKLNKNFFTKKKIIIYADEPVILTDENNEPVMDEDNEPVMVKIPKRDDKDKVIYDDITEEYKEPKGVTQDGREAIRIHNQTTEDIKKFRERNESFWEKFNKHGGMTVVGLAIVVLGMIMGMKLMTDAWSDGVAELTGEIKDASDNIKWWQQPDALDKISNAVVEKQDENNAPPLT